MTTTKIHIDLIMAGDTILHNNEVKTVCSNNIKLGGCGTTIFGDSYRLGTLPVVKIISLN